MGDIVRREWRLEDLNIPKGVEILEREPFWYWRPDDGFRIFSRKTPFDSSGPFAPKLTLIDIWRWTWLLGQAFQRPCGDDFLFTYQGWLVASAIDSAFCADKSMIYIGSKVSSEFSVYLHRTDVGTLLRVLEDIHRALTEPIAYDCTHCGDVAIVNPRHDGDGYACMSCGFPGHFSDDETEGYWCSSDEPKARCKNLDCAECAF